MKRDTELIRKILLFLEENATPEHTTEVKISGHSEEEIMYHMKLLLDNGYIEGYDSSPVKGIYISPTGLTWTGHDFLDTVRSENIWRETKKKLAEQGGSMPLEIVKAVAIQIAAKAMGL
jgi:hypothetical protein